jgi:hypothetical protein
MLIAYKCATLCKKLDYDRKSEPPYLATTIFPFSFLSMLQVPKTLYGSNHKRMI